MKHSVWNWLVISSLLAVTVAAEAATRPQYGGTVRVTIGPALASLDPADGTMPDSFARRSVTWLLFDTLISEYESGHAKLGLAESWQTMRGNQRWVLRTRRGIKFHDGTPLTAEAAAASLRFANPSWNVSVEGDAVVIERDVADPELLAELALPRNAIVKRESDGSVSGTGPFRIADWQRGKKLTLAANEDYWRGRPFLDGLEIEVAKNSRDQVAALELGKADLVEVAPELAHRVSQAGRPVVNSLPLELLALIFSRDASSPDEKTLREALALSIDRGSIRSVLLQGAGQPAAGILPTWLSGYGFVFPTEPDLTKARQLRNQSRTAPTWTIGYDANDILGRLLAERIALNAKDAGLSLQPTSSSNADLRLARIPLASSDPWVALAEASSQAGVPTAKTSGSSAEDLYSSERAALASGRLIPLFHLPVSYAFAPTLRNGALRADGSFDLSDAWLENSRP